MNRLEKQNNVLGVISFWCTEAALNGKFFSKSKNKKHFIWMHGQDARKGNTFIFFIRPKANELVAISESLSEEMFLNYRTRPAHVITNGIDPGEFRTPANTQSIALLAVGSLITLKQYHLFVELVAAVKKDFPDIKASLIGDGPERGNLQTMISSFNLENTITLEGELSHADVLQRMSRSKILIHPSSYEGYSTVCLEALYAGCHVISFTQPETHAIKHWHIVNELREMTDTCRHILQSENNFDPVLVHTMDDSARQMMTLFNYDSTAR